VVTEHARAHGILEPTTDRDSYAMLANAKRC
jgi:hypothetical protein